MVLSHREQLITRSSVTIHPPTPSKPLPTFFFFPGKIPGMVFSMAEQTGVQMLVPFYVLLGACSIIHKKGIIIILFLFNSVVVRIK